MSTGCTYRFIESSLSLLSKEIEYDVELRQQPIRAKMSIPNERDRRPIEPPPILQLHWKNASEDEFRKCLQSPFYFVVANLVTEDDPETPLAPTQEYLSGSNVSSLYRLRDIDNSDGGFFVFGDLAVKKEGKFKLRFSLFEIVEGQVQNRKTLLSDTFTVFIPKKFPGPVEATFLSRTFSDQGVKMRIRKEHRLQSRKRKSEASEKEPQPSKKYQIKHSKLTTTSPSYNTSSSDVLFGRWQAKTAQNIEQHASRYQQYHEEYAPPSPEAPIYSHPYHHNRSLSSHSSSSSLSTSTYNQSPLNIPFTSSPPTLSMALPTDTAFSKYHVCSDKRSDAHHYPPLPVADLHQLATGTTSWGICLPPLKAIMNEYDKDSAPLVPLLLPPPSPLIHAYY